MPAGHLACACWWVTFDRSTTRAGSSRSSRRNEWRADASSGRAACWAAPARSTACSTSVANMRTSTTGAPGRDGLGLSRGVAVLPQVGASCGGESEYHGASGELCLGPAQHHPGVRGLAQRPAEAGLLASADFSMAPRTRGWGATSSRSMAAGAAMRPRPSCILCAIGRTCRSTGGGGCDVGAGRIWPSRRRAVALRTAVCTEARADAEVVLSAGALQSSSCCSLGHRPGFSTLRAHGSIAAQVMRPAGCQSAGPLPGARDRSSCAIGFRSNDQVQSCRARAQGCAVLFGRRGHLTVGAGQVGGMVRTPVAKDGRADVLFNVMPLSVDKPGDPLHRFSGFAPGRAMPASNRAAAAWACARPIRWRRRASCPTT